MRCDDVEDLLLKQQDGELSEAQARELSAHLAGCGQCREFAAGLARLDRLLHAERTVTPQPGNMDGMWSSVQERLTRARPERRTLVLRAALVGTAAVAAASIVLAFCLWWSADGLRRDADTLRRTNIALSEKLRRLPVRDGAHEGEVRVHLTDLDRSTRLYRELADFYRMPVLWVVEGDRGVEMKLGSESGGTQTPGQTGRLLYVEVTVADSLEPTSSATTRILSRPGEQVAATLEGSGSAAGRWRLECVPSEVGREGIAVAVKLQCTNAGEPAMLATRATVPAGATAQLGSLTVAGRLHEVRVFVQQALTADAVPAARGGGGAT